MSRFLTKVDNMVSSINSSKLDAFLRHVERLGAIGIVFAGAAGLIRFADKVTPILPVISIVVGVIALFAVFILAAFISVGAWHESKESFERLWVGHLVGFSTFLVSMLLAVGTMFWALKA